MSKRWLDFCKDANADDSFTILLDFEGDYVVQDDRLKLYGCWDNIEDAEKFVEMLCLYAITPGYYSR